MIKKILSAVLAMTMVLSMAVSSSAALGKPGKVTSSTNSTQSTTSSSTSTTSRSSQAYDLCQTYLKNDTLALRMHNTFLNGLRAANSRITVDISGYSENEVYTAFQTSLQMIRDEIIRSSRRYAKRQISFLSTMDGFSEISPSDTEGVISLLASHQITVHM